jgi:hypothetical protein
MDEINLIKDELNKDPTLRDLFSLDSIVAKNKFMSGFEKGIRIGLLESA